MPGRRTWELLGALGALAAACGGATSVPADATHADSADASEAGPVDGADADGEVDGAPGDGGGCAIGGTSTLAGAAIEFPAQDCTFTLAEAAAGLAIDYRVVVTGDVPGPVIPEPQDAGHCDGAHASGLILFEDLAGGGERYCLCDVGLCPGPDDTPVTLTPGSYDGSFSWTGRNWGGPSDTSNPLGAPFPAGDYTLTVSAAGTQAGAAFRVEGTFVLHLVP